MPTANQATVVRREGATSAETATTSAADRPAPKRTTPRFRLSSGNHAASQNEGCGPSEDMHGATIRPYRTMLPTNAQYQATTPLGTTRSQRTTLGRRTALRFSGGGLTLVSWHVIDHRPLVVRRSRSRRCRTISTPPIQRRAATSARLRGTASSAGSLRHDHSLIERDKPPLFPLN
jgi:hypothetical protein